MRGMQRLFIILMLLGTLIACSGWQDMDEYNQKRDKAIENKDRSEDDIIDCNVVDCPEMIRDTP